MLRRAFFVVLALCLTAPLLAEQVDIKHPQIKDGTKGLYVDGTAYVPIDVVNQLFPGTFAWDSDRRLIVSPDHGSTRVKPILFVGDKDSSMFELLRNAGLPVEQSARLPGQFGGYSAIVIADDKACDPTRTDQLDEYLKKGGGLILTGRQAARLAGNVDRDELGPVGRWFGAGCVTEYDTDGRYAKSVVGHPFETRIDKQERLWSGGGGDEIAGIASEHVAASTQSLVVTEDARINNVFYSDETYTFAFAHPYGPGRIYWQSFVPPDCPKLVELYVGGVKWAGGFIKGM